MADKVTTPWLAGGPWPITQGYGPTAFGAEPGAHGYAHFHEGIDISAPSGTDVIAAMSGWVDERENPGGFGHYAIVHPDDLPGVEVILGHLAGFKLAGDQHVPAGTVIGYEGSTGNSTGPHLHFQENKQAPAKGFGGSDVDPTSLLAMGGSSASSSLSGAATQTEALPVPNPIDPWGLSGAAGQFFGEIAGASTLGIAQGLGAAAAGAGHGVANALTNAGVDVGVFLRRQLVAIVVAVIFTVVLFL